MKFKNLFILWLCAVSSFLLCFFAVFNSETKGISEYNFWFMFFSPLVVFMTIVLNLVRIKQNGNKLEDKMIGVLGISIGLLIISMAYPATPLIINQKEFINKETNDLKANLYALYNQQLDLQHSYRYDQISDRFNGSDKTFSEKSPSGNSTFTYRIIPNASFQENLNNSFTNSSFSEYKPKLYQVGNNFQITYETPNGRKLEVVAPRLIFSFIDSVEEEMINPILSSKRYAVSYKAISKNDICLKQIIHLENKEKIEKDICLKAGEEKTVYAKAEGQNINLIILEKYEKDIENSFYVYDRMVKFDEKNAYYHDDFFCIEGTIEETQDKIALDPIEDANSKGVQGKVTDFNSCPTGNKNPLYSILGY